MLLAFGFLSQIALFSLLSPHFLFLPLPALPGLGFLKPACVLASVTHFKKTPEKNSLWLTK